MRFSAATCAILWFAVPTPAQSESPTDAIARAILEANLPAVDDPDLRARKLLETARSAASSPAAALLIGDIQRLVPILQEPDQCLEGLTRFLASDPHGLGVLEARVLQTDLLWQAGRRDEALALLDAERHATHWLVIGPFGDSGDYYQGVVYPPELGFPNPGEVLEGRFDLLTPRVVTRKRHERLVDLEAPGMQRPGCYYALHQVTADAATPGYASVICRGSFELFVNGSRVGGVDRYTQRLGAVTTFPIHLRAGHNQILVKTTLNELHSVGLRLHDAMARSIAGIREFEEPTEVRQPAPPDGGASPAPFVNGLNALVSAAADVGGESRQRLLLAAGLTAYRQGHQDRGIGFVHELERDPPAAPTLALAHAELLLRAAPIPMEIRRGRARLLFEAHAQTGPGHHQLDLMRASFFEDQDKREDAVRLLQTRVATGTAGPETFERLNRLLTQLRFAAAAQRNREAWREAFPRDVRPTIALALERERGGDRRGAMAMLVETLAMRPIDGLRRRVLSLARDLGDFAVAMRMVEELHIFEPEAPAALEDRATTLHALGQTEEATAADRALVAHATASAGQIRQAGHRLLRAGHGDEADAAYRRSLDLDPSQHALRRLVVRRSGREEHAAIAGFRRDGDEIIAGFTPTDREQGSSSTLLLDQLIVEFHEDGSRTEETHLVRRINDLAGVERYQNASAAAEADELVLLRTVGVDGQSYYPQRVAGSFGMPRLEPGAFVEEIHRRYAGAPGANPWRGPNFLFRSQDEPYLLSELVIILPPDHQGTFRTRNFPDPPEVRELADGRRARVYRRTDVDVLPTEAMAPPLAAVVPVVTYGEDVSSDATARDLAAAGLARARTTPIVAAATAAVIEGCESDLAKVEAIHDFVHENIAAGRSNPEPTEILMQRRGPRFFLEVAMLELAGVPFRHAAVAAVRDEMRTEALPLFAGSERYEVPAVRVEPAGEQPIWLFAGAPRHAPLGMISAEQLGAPAMLLSVPDAEYTRLPGGLPEVLLGVRVEAQVTIGDDAGATMRAQAHLRGTNGLRGAEDVRNYEGTVQEVVGRQLTGQLFPGWTLGGAELLNLDEKGEPLGIRSDLTRTGALEPAGDVFLLDLPLPKSQLLARFGDRDERSLPLHLTDMTSSSWSVTVDPGDAYRFAEVPAPFRTRHPLVELSLTYRRDGQRLVIRREMVQRPGTIPPSEFGEWRALLRRADTAEDKRLRLVAR